MDESNVKQRPPSGDLNSGIWNAYEILPAGKDLTCARSTPPSLVPILSEFQFRPQGLTLLTLAFWGGGQNVQYAKAGP